ncbi:hypoxanthine-guanine phosphoribosyltransferase [Luteibacter yeojuensis]|uniref:Hypoxanthine-guanine phosphoribosyltransferase n=1 Tax=Luteibacter yeojuensis TaxID=345309 RepID=A0A0F3KX17_9GAMM|nr:hypoxanthine-guanine phosphoribosyltransferase [Luteibacter yeojuensis]KJV34644.1 hypoxanthine-guanine phosphoribosyltransferase [Luteibacter yeojuensis]
MTATASLEHALAHSDVLFTRDQLDVEIARMGREIDTALAGERPVFLTVMHGALIFAGQLALAIKTDLEFDYVHATRYRGATRGSDLHWLRRPEVPLNGRTVVLVDDILDEGHTLKAVRDACLEMGATRVLLAVLCTKLHDRRAAGIEADFNGVDLPDRYVFGYGMDFHEQARNLPAIHALKD